MNADCRTGGSSGRQVLTSQFLFEQAPLPYFVLSPEGTFQQVNDRACELFSRDRASLIGQSFVEIHLGHSRDSGHPNQAARILEKLKNEEAIRGETLEMVRPNGTHFWGRLSSRPITTASGTIIHLVQVDEITEDELQRKALAEGDRRLWDVLERAPDPTFITDARGKILLMNRRAETVFGIDRGEFVRTPFLQLISGTEQSSMQAELERFAAKSDRDPWRVGKELEARCPGGNSFPVDLHLSKIEWDRESYLIITVRDVSTARGLQRELITTNEELNRQQDLFGAVFRDVPYAMLLGDIDQEVTRINPAAEQLFGYASEELIGQNTRGLYVNQQDYDKRQASNFNPKKETSTVPYIVEYRRKDGSTFFGETVGTPLKNPDGETIALLGVVKDVTERLEAQRLLEENEDRFRQMTEGLDVVMWLSDIWPEEDVLEQIIYVSPAVESIWGVSRKQLYQSSSLWLDRIHPDDRGRVQQALSRLTDTGQFNEQYRVVHPDGGVRWVQDRSFVIDDQTPEGGPMRIPGFAEDITMHKQSVDQLNGIRAELEFQNRELESQVRRDSLTGLANRRAYRERIEEEWSRCERNSSPLSLVMLDIDFFKQFNDTYGHRAGDRVLKEIGVLLGDKGAQRAGDTAVRYGGEEFILILPDTDPAGARTIAEFIRREIEQRAIEHRGSKISSVLSASLGIASVVPDASRSSDDLFKQVDRALYKAKRKGRNQVRFLPVIRD